MLAASRTLKLRIADTDGSTRNVRVQALHWFLLTRMRTERTISTMDIEMQQVTG